MHKIPALAVELALVQDGEAVPSQVEAEGGVKETRSMCIERQGIN